MQTNQSRVHGWKKVTAQHGNEGQGTHAEYEKQNYKEPCAFQAEGQRRAIAAAHAVKPLRETALRSRKNIVSGGVFLAVMIFEQVHRHRRHERPRQNIRCQHGENHGFGERNEKEFRHARQKKHRDEHNTDAQRRDQRWNGDFLRTVQNRADGVLSLRQISLNILDGHGSVVHKDADRKRQAAKRHEIDRFVQRAQDRNRN